MGILQKRIHESDTTAPPTGHRSGHLLNDRKAQRIQQAKNKRLGMMDTNAKKVPKGQQPFYHTHRPKRHYAVSGTFHGSIISAGSEGDARRLFHAAWNGESIISIRQIKNWNSFFENEN